MTKRDFAGHRLTQCRQNGYLGANPSRHQKSESHARFHRRRHEGVGVYSTPETFNPNTYQPTLEATARHNYVELMAKKQGADSLNVCWRPAGPSNGTLLSVKRARFPFHDDTPAPAGQTMQAREYMAMGVIAGTEIGNPSNIASAVFQA